VFKHAIFADMPMFSLPHKKNENVNKTTKSRAKFGSFFLEVMSTPELPVGSVF